MKMVDPEPCKELRSRISAAIFGWDCPLLTFIYPGFDWGRSKILHHLRNLVSTVLVSPMPSQLVRTELPTIRNINHCASQSPSPRWPEWPASAASGAPEKKKSTCDLRLAPPVSGQGGDTGRKETLIDLVAVDPLQKVDFTFWGFSGKRLDFNQKVKV